MHKIAIPFHLTSPYPLSPIHKLYKGILQFNFMSYYERNKEKLIEYQRQYNDDNKDKVKEYMRQYYINHIKPYRTYVKREKPEPVDKKKFDMKEYQRMYKAKKRAQKKKELIDMILNPPPEPEPEPEPEPIFQNIKKGKNGLFVLEW